MKKKDQKEEGRGGRQQNERRGEQAYTKKRYDYSVACPCIVIKYYSVQYNEKLIIK